ncbi:MAG TPA: 3-oxoacyl-ACP synthase, partial [Anaerolineales bacterium]|nr:3-oxoacyl-ACP synthase [Anaerolineales bacterium]
MTRYAHITGWGMAVPEKILTNDDIAQFVETSDEWIKEMTGIRERRIANPEETTGMLATQAALKAMEVANVRPTD